MGPYSIFYCVLSPLLSLDTSGIQSSTKSLLEVEDMLSPQHGVVSTPDLMETRLGTGKVYPFTKVLVAPLLLGGGNDSKRDTVEDVHAADGARGVIVDSHALQGKRERGPFGVLWPCDWRVTTGLYSFPAELRLGRGRWCWS